MADLIKTLSEAFGVSGDEAAVRDIIIDEIRDFADDIQIDSMGNIIAFKKGAADAKTAAVTASMDECGLIISDITDKGYLKFKLVGDIDPRKLVSKKVAVGSEGVKGVIGMKAIHLQTKNERENVVPASKLFIDIGAKDKKNAEKRVKIGDYAAFKTDFAVLGDNIKGKALERSGACCALIKAFKEPCANNMYACFLAQHFVGARGAMIVSHRIDADAVLCVGAADTTDMCGCDKNYGGAELGKGVIINYSDKFFISDKNAADYMAKTAKKAGITVQERVLENADGGAGRIKSKGAAVLSALIPCRYSRSPVSLMNMKDVDAAADYISLFLNKIGDIL